MRSPPFLLAALSSQAVTASAGDGDATAPLTFTALTGALPLYPGEVTNTWHRLDIPSGPLAISEFSADGTCSLIISVRLAMHCNEI